MMALPANTRIWIAAGVTDLRRGVTGLSARVETKLEQKPFSGQVFVFRGRRGDLIKVLWYDGDGLCLYAKRLERGRFVWPQATSGTVSLTRAQLSMLLEGIDYRRRPERTWEPHVVVVGWNDTTATVQSVKDSAGNNYSLAIGPTSGTALRQSIYYAPNIVGGSNTVTVTFSQAANYPDVRILEYRGVNPVDVTAGASGSS